ncbi:unnamed protein product [Clonostachys solani]|uniref:Heterokaryon incompatibility domain-containing protein n=1 Tax=Clonostachys solani TaxID=160281 RepID=A0A9P0EF86_9HYPO|nr:unnamed protein product [Clonostachys solani]
MSSSDACNMEDEHRALTELHARVLGLCEALRRTTPAEKQYARVLEALLAEIGRKCSLMGTHRSYNPSLKLFLVDLENKLQSIPMHPLNTTDEKGPSEFHLSHQDMKDIMYNADRCLYGEIRTERTLSENAHSSPGAPPMLYIDTWGIQHGPWKDQIEHIRNALLVNRHLTDWIQPTELRQWIDQCDAQHADHCGPQAASKKIFPHRPKRLVDLEHMCIIPAEPHHRYVALSYVWGTGSSLQSLKHNLDLLLIGDSREAKDESTKPSLNPKNLLRHATGTANSVVSESLPPTIQHVLELVRRLGERYLWIDSLCIIQDDGNEKSEELGHMGSIYANAYVTIVAAGGNSYTGLHGIENITPPMERPNKTPLYLVAPKAASEEIKAAHGYISRSMWNRRAWTFQEQIFSRRLLVLSEARITWECHCAVWFEGLEVVQGQCKKKRQVVPGLSFSPEANMKEYSKHVTEYNRRVLTYPEDALDAFSGILGALSGIFVGGFICGLPRVFFDTTLLWYNQIPVELRKPAHPTPGTAMPPTWSWAAWSGSIGFPENDILPLADWWYRENNTTAWEPISSQRSQGGATVLNPPVVEDDWLPHLLYARVQRAVFAAMDMDSAPVIYLKGVADDGVGAITHCVPMPTSSASDLTLELVAVSESLINSALATNVLWVERNGLTTYRKGVGRVLKSAWELQEPDVIDLLLG